MQASVINGNTCNDDDIKANYANEFFTNIGHNLGQQFTDNDSYLLYLTNNVSSAFSFEQITLQQIELLVRNFQNNSPGHDDLSISIYNENFHLLGENLLSICNKCLSQGIFPSQFNIAKITNVFKKDDKKEISNYRPISV